MPNDNNTAARSLLNSISSINEALIELAQSLRDKPGVKTAEHGLDIRKYESGSILEAYVDVETHTGKAYSWWLELRWDQSMWTVESSVRTIHNKGQDLLVQFPLRKTQGFAEFLKHLKTAADELVESATNFRFLK